MMVPWLCRALETSGRTDALVDLITNPDDDGWANILARDGTFTWETWHCRDPELPTSERRNRSESHAMGAPVLVSIQRALLGVRLVGCEARTSRFARRSRASSLLAEPSQRNAGRLRRLEPRGREVRPRGDGAVERDGDGNAAGRRRRDGKRNDRLR